MITKKAENKKSYYKNINFTNSAREGWELILKTLDFESKILLPSYIGVTYREGSGIFDPVIQTGISYSFYLLNNDLSISVSEIEKKLKTRKYKLILLVHYFGFKIKNIKEIVKLCKKYKVIVVEDCAHLYNLNVDRLSTAGSYGDFVFYSLHKFFPFNKGGMIIQNNLELKNPDFTSINFDKNNTLEIFKYNVRSIAKKRIKNFKIYDQLIINGNGIKKLKSLKEEDIPQNFPIVIENELREKLYFWLIKHNVTLIALYYKLIDPLLDEKYSSMQDLSNSILNLPVHQDIERKDIIQIVDLIKEGLIDLDK